MSSLVRLTAALAGRYTIEKELGRGGMATVYIARDLKHDREVALKVLRPELASVLGAERFLQEVRITAQLDHPRILTLIDSGESGGFLWYVLPYVRGESLRDKLTREKQLSIDEAIRITTQVASALEYAHRHGVIHRDIKPENILLHEGEAVVADFGIALAVREAGGSRLTESGLSLGTPQYMSPEQATGDRQIDARSDVYSLAAVLYEMLVGDPPHTGTTVQAVIAKLLTEPPTRVRVIRATVPQSVDEAIAKGLAKVPADRFPGARELADALVAPEVHSESRRSRVVLIGAATATVLLSAGVLVWWATQQGQRAHGTWVVHDRYQLTFTGNATSPAISGDGKQLAYSTKNCTGATCSYGIEIQDLNGEARRRLVDGAEEVDAMTWSPDRRFLLFDGQIGARYGDYIVSTLGGPPRFVGRSLITFTPDGDSLLVPDWSGSDSVGWVALTTLDGEHGDSIRVEHPGGPLGRVWLLPGGRWVVVKAVWQRRNEWRILDRHGGWQSAFRLPVDATPTLARVTPDALWAQFWSPGSYQVTVVRVPIDGARGRIGTSGDTILQLHEQNFDVTRKGTEIVYADGTYESSVWAVDLADLQRGRLPDERRLLASTLGADAVVSHDGRLVLLTRSAPGAGDRGTIFSVVPFAGGAEIMNASNVAVEAGPVWMPGDTAFCFGEPSPGGTRFVTLDARTGKRLTTFAITDSVVVDFAPVAGNGWAWITSNGGIERSLRVQRAGERAQDVAIGYPANPSSLAVAPGGTKLAIAAYAVADTTYVDVVSLGDTVVRRWLSLTPTFNTELWWLDDGSLMVGNWESNDVVTLYRVHSRSRVDTIGTVPRSINLLSMSQDGRKVTATVSEFHGDIWLAHVARAGGSRK